MRMDVTMHIRATTCLDGVIECLLRYTKNPSNPAKLRVYHEIIMKPCRNLKIRYFVK
jgi:hypothetical protein